MKRILSIIFIITSSLGYLYFYDKKEIPKQVNIPIQTHIEPEKRMKTKQIKKENIIIEQKQTKEKQESQPKRQTKTSTQKDITNDSPPVKSNETTNQQYLSNLQINQIKSELLILINQERSSPVSLYSSLEKSTSLRANEANQKWSHTRPNGTRWDTVLSNIININKVPHGENLGQIKVNPNNINISMLVASLHQGLVNSPTHYKVMTNENYKKVNIGVYSTLKNNMITITIAQHFIK